MANTASLNTGNLNPAASFHKADHRPLSTDCLPPEILSDIFLTLKYSSKYNSPFHWIPVSWVSTYWRRVAVNCSQLWTSITLSTNPSMVDLFLSRSGVAPLSLSLNMDAITSLYPMRRDVLCEALGQHTRVRSLDFRAGKGFDIQTLLTMPILTNAPIMETLKLAGRRFPGPCHLPCGILNENGTPALKHLEIRDCRVQWESLPPIHGLTYLKIKNPKASDRPPADGFAESLYQLPHLRTLVLHHFIPTTKATLLPDSDQRLSMLDHLELVDNSRVIADFFLLAPTIRARDTHLTLEGVTNGEGNEALYLDFVTAFTSCWRDPKSSATRTSLAVHELELIHGSSSSQRVVLHFKPHPDVEARLTIHIKHYLPVGLMKALQDQQHLATLSSLTVASSPYASREFWSQFMSLPDLKTINLVDCSVHSHVLASFLSVLRGDQTGLPPFPFVSTLEFINLKNLDDDNRFVSDLFKIISRRPRDHRIQELRFTDCPETNSIMQDPLWTRVPQLKIVVDREFDWMTLKSTEKKSPAAA